MTEPICMNEQQHTAHRASSTPSSSLICEMYTIKFRIEHIEHTEHFRIPSFLCYCQCKFKLKMAICTRVSGTCTK